MGRPYQQELAKLPENISFANKQPVNVLTDAIELAKDGRILACGAGGSYSAAAFAQLLFQEAGSDCHAVTPLHILQTSRPLEHTTLFLFTAAGRNTDVLRVIQHASSLSIRVVLVCATKGSPAAKIAGKGPSNCIFEFSYPARRDGFLAVNSLAVTWWLLARAFGHKVPDAKAAASFLQANHGVKYIAADRRHACVLLHDRWTKPVAVDLESKISEAALCAPLMCDWRQFGHGRHHWLAKNAAFSSVLSTETAAVGSLATKTLGLIPKSIPRVRLCSRDTGITGVCEVLLRSFVFIGAVGKQVGLDPGRPGVPPFGSALYHLAVRMPKTKTRDEQWCIGEAVGRKLQALGPREHSTDIRRRALQAAEGYLEALFRARFAAVVLDFDGTIAMSGLMPDQSLPKEIVAVLLPLLKNGILVGIATGRGDSCHSNLTKSFPASVWPQILICHYNGASVGNLRDLIKSPMQWKENADLRDLFSELEADPLLPTIADIRFKGPQITIRPKAKHQTSVVARLVEGRMVRKAHCRLVSSSHTLDIIPAASTKLTLVEYIKKLYAPGTDILTIGDRGDVAGNDFELLSETFSLSVDRVSPDFRSCWNFLPHAVSHSRGTSHYLNNITVSQGIFRFCPK